MKKQWTILELLKEGILYLEKKGVTTPRLDAELLLAHCLRKERINLYIDYDSPVNEKELSCFRGLILRRVNREPVAYLIGHREFWSLKLTVNKDVLIPRPETEILVEQAIEILKPLCNDNKHIQVLEIGTGSGAISAALAKEVDGIILYTTDISPAALEVARRNIERCGFLNRVRFACGRDVALFKCDGIFDMLVANPPYITSDEIEELEPEIKNHEPRHAFNGGKDGLDFYRLCIPKISAVLKKNAWVIFEIGAGQAEAVSAMFHKTSAYMNVRIAKDYAGYERAVLAQKK
jgi:release factor glutamine methyltransferase